MAPTFECQERDITSMEVPDEELKLHPANTGSGRIDRSVVRSHADHIIKDELHDAASKISEGLLTYGIIEMKEPLHGPSSIFSVACDQARLVLGRKRQKSSDDSFQWSWHSSLLSAKTGGIGSEDGAVRFLNVLGLAAYLVAVRLGLKDIVGDDVIQPRRPRLRFTRPPQERKPVPYGYKHETQNCCPDVLGLPTGCYYSEKDGSDALPHDNPALIIQDHFPLLPDIEEGSWLTPNGLPMDHKEKNAVSEWWKIQLSLVSLGKKRYGWSHVQVTGEARLFQKGAAINQALVYMRALRLAQPWRCFVIGLTINKTEIGIIRADPNGAEQCFVDHSSLRGMIEMVRMTLGMMMASDQDLGHHPWMELGTISRAKNLEAERQQSSGSNKKQKVEFEHQVVQYINIPASASHHPSLAPDDSRILDCPSARYFVHELLEDRGSLVGRCSRLFVVSRQVEPPADTSSAPHFEGPYILKMFYAEITSSCVETHIMEDIKKHELRHVLLPNRLWYCGRVLQGIRHIKSTENIPGSPSNRLEIISETDMKCRLDEYTSWGELVQALMDSAEGVNSLFSIDILHRDVSCGNLLLARDHPGTRFLEEARALFHDHIFSTRLINPERVGGYLHDLDMAGRVSRLDSMTTDDADDAGDILEQAHARTQAGIGKLFRTGTACYMSVRVLMYGGHVVQDDLHSLLFVVYMFFLNFIPRPDKTIPCPYSHNTRPPSVMTWVQPRPDTIDSVGGSKLAFFGEDTQWLVKLADCSPDWFYFDGKPGPNNRHPKKAKYLGLVLALHRCLWATSKGPTKRIPSTTVTPQDLLTALQTYKSELSSDELDTL